MIDATPIPPMIDAMPPSVTPIVVIPGSTVFSASSSQLRLRHDPPVTLVIVAVYWNDSAATASVSSNHVPSYTALPRQSIATGCKLNVGTNAQLWVYGVAAASGPDTLTVTQSTSSGRPRRDRRGVCQPRRADRDHRHDRVDHLGISRTPGMRSRRPATR